MKEEICENCGRAIAAGEQAYLSQNKILCEKCDGLLRRKRDGFDAKDVIKNPPEICKMCGKVIPANERATITDGGLVCVDCENRPDVSFDISEGIKSQKTNDKNSVSNARQSLNMTNEETVKRTIGQSKDEINKLPSCFFCHKNFSQDNTNHTVELFKLIKVPCAGFSVKGWRHGYHTRRIKVPRCESCKNQHDRDKISKDKLNLTGFIAGAMIGFLIGLLLGIKAAINEGRMHYIVIVGPFIFALFTGYLGILVSNLFTSSKIRSSNESRTIYFCNSYPPVEDALKQGWKIGASPEKSYNAVWMGNYEDGE
jgi:hypothetical protein